MSDGRGSEGNIIRNGELACGQEEARQRIEDAVVGRGCGSTVYLWTGLSASEGVVSLSERPLCEI